MSIDILIRVILQKEIRSDFGEYDPTASLTFMVYVVIYTNTNK